MLRVAPKAWTARTELYTSWKIGANRARKSSCPAPGSSTPLKNIGFAEKRDPRKRTRGVPRACDKAARTIRRVLEPMSRHLTGSDTSSDFGRSPARDVWCHNLRGPIQDILLQSIDPTGRPIGLFRGHRRSVPPTHFRKDGDNAIVPTTLAVHYPGE